MAGTPPEPEEETDVPRRDVLVHTALWLSVIAVVWCLGIGTWSIAARLLAGSLGVEDAILKTNRFAPRQLSCSSQR
jgi:hypothetical protein